MGQIDIEHFNRISLNKPDFSKEIIARFLVQSEEYEQKLSKAVAEQDFKTVKSVVQQLKAQALVFGAQQLVEHIKRIERASMDKYEHYAAVIEEIRHLFQALIQDAKALQ